MYVNLFVLNNNVMIKTACLWWFICILFLFWIYKKQQIWINLNSYYNANVLLKKTHNSYFIVLKNQVVHKSVATFFLNSKIYYLKACFTGWKWEPKFSVRKTTTQFFKYYQKSAWKSTKITILLAYVRPLKANYRLFLRLLTLNSFFLTVITVFYM